MDGTPKVEKEGPYTADPFGVTFHDNLLYVLYGIINGFMEAYEIAVFGVRHIEGLGIEFHGVLYLVGDGFSSRWGGEIGLLVVEIDDACFEVFEGVALVAVHLDLGLDEEFMGNRTLLRNASLDGFQFEKT